MNLEYNKIRRVIEIVTVILISSLHAAAEKQRIGRFFRFPKRNRLRKLNPKSFHLRLQLKSKSRPFGSMSAEQ